MAKKKSLFKEMAEAGMAAGGTPMEHPMEARVRKAEGGYIVTVSGGKHGFQGKDKIYKDLSGVGECLEDTFGKGKAEEKSEEY